jgi:hypothetical protein
MSVFYCSDAAIVGSNPIPCIDVRLRSVCEGVHVQRKSEKEDLDRFDLWRHARNGRRNPHCLSFLSVVHLAKVSGLHTVEWQDD